MSNRNAEDSVPYEGFVLISSVFKRANTVRPYRVADDLCGFTDSRKVCPYDFLLNLLFVGDDAHIVPMKIFIIRLCRIGTLRTAFPTRTLCYYRAFSNEHTVRPYRVADDLCGFIEKTAIICLGSFGKGAGA